MYNFKKILVRHILDTTTSKDIPTIVKKEFKGDFKMYLYTLTTQEIEEMIINRR